MSTTLRRNATPEPTTEAQSPEAETQMRRALGLLPSGSPRSRTRAGDGPVVEHRSERHAGSSINRVAAAEAALAEERQAREQLARQLREAETALREARTKLGHAELAHDELLAAIAVERNARAAAEEQVRQLSEKLQLQATEAPPEAPDLQDRRGRKPATTEAAPPAKRRGRPLGSISKNRRVAAKAPEPESDESQAVEWWVPGWQDRI